MKVLLTFSLVLFSFLGFSQSGKTIQNTTDKQLPLFIENINTNYFESAYSNLDSSLASIKKVNLTIPGFDYMRQGAAIIFTDNICESFESVEIETRPNLNIELQRIMFTGNNRNPNSVFFPNIKE